ncbi:MAG: hypothetical protein IKF36_05555 [Bacilli bacterium]|nr:hypothetical protein [Bacilli bacterium]
MKCDKCGNEIEKDSYYCQECGNRIEENNKPINTNANKNYEQVVELSKEGLSVPYIILGALFPYIGIILGIIWNRQYPSRAKSLIIGFMISIFLFIFIGFAIVFSNLSNYGR